MTAKTFEVLFGELRAKAERGEEGSRTVELLGLGVHAIGKKIVEEAAEVWMAAEYEDGARTAEEISQLLRDLLRGAGLRLVLGGHPHLGGLL
ncbi:MAG: phosphoribosyl-ATP diphosphatase, partial [Catenulispora sp.]